MFGSRIQPKTAEVYVPAMRPVEPSQLYDVFNFQSLRSGSTGVWCVLRPGMLTVGWVGDSQIMMVRDGQPVCLMEPHKPERDVSIFLYVSYGYSGISLFDISQPE